MLIARHVRAVQFCPPLQVRVDPWPCEEEVERPLDEMGVLGGEDAGAPGEFSVALHWPPEALVHTKWQAVHQGIPVTEALPDGLVPGPEGHDRVSGAEPVLAEHPTISVTVSTVEARLDGALENMFGGAVANPDDFEWFGNPLTQSIREVRVRDVYVGVQGFLIISGVLRVAEHGVYTEFFLGFAYRFGDSEHTRAVLQGPVGSLHGGDYKRWIIAS